MAQAHIFDKTVQKTQNWLDEIKREMQTANDNRAYLALRTVLHSLRNHLQTNEAIHLGAELPMLVRGLYFEGWDPHVRLPKEKDKKEYFNYFRHYFMDESDAEIEKIIGSVFKVLEKKISNGEIQHVKENLPHHIRELLH